jgi:hypothetical protein
LSEEEEKKGIFSKRTEKNCAFGFLCLSSHPEAQTHQTQPSKYFVPNIMIPKQGDQIGRFFACWAAVDFGQFVFKNFTSSSNFGVLLS